MPNVGDPFHPDDPVCSVCHYLVKPSEDFRVIELPCVCPKCKVTLKRYFNLKSQDELKALVHTGYIQGIK